MACRDTAAKREGVRTDARSHRNLEGARLKPLVVAIGGTPNVPSSTHHALTLALQAAEASGTRTKLFDGAFLATLPSYMPGRLERTATEQEFIGSVKAADGIIVATPAYHGGISGLVKNALDLLEDLAGDERPYLEGRAVGCVVTAFGLQGAATTLISLRSIVHALRGWPTPLGVTADTSSTKFVDGICKDEKCAFQLDLVGRQVADFALTRRR